MCSGDVVAVGQIRSNTVTVLTIAGVGATPKTVLLDVSLGQVFTLIATNNFTLNATNLSPGAVVFLKITGSPYAMTLGANIATPLAGPFGTPANYMFFCDGDKLNL
jgi:hypothetical protein